MTWGVIAALAIVLADGAVPLKVAVTAAAAAAAEARPERDDSAAFDADAERQLLQMANQARSKAGAAPLQPDEGLTRAARAHAAAMAGKQQLSHQLSGEPPLQKRLARSPLHLDKAGENVALDMDVEQAHEGLMLSPPHRANLLNTSYNVAGFAVVRSGRQVYVVQDFGHSLPGYSVDQAEGLIAAAVKQWRSQNGLPRLAERSQQSLRETACSMARQDKLSTSGIGNRMQARYVVSYNNNQPQVLPASAGKAIGDRDLRSFSVGACYARTETHPNGVYWVTLLFY